MMSEFEGLKITILQVKLKTKASPSGEVGGANEQDTQ